MASRVLKYDQGGLEPSQWSETWSEWSGTQSVWSIIVKQIWEDSQGGRGIQGG